MSSTRLTVSLAAKEGGCTMKMVSYDNVVFPNEFRGMREDSGEYDKWPDYESLLDMMSREFLKERYALCLQLKKDDEVLGLCPFHDDKQPSLVINPSKNLWHCLGACQAGGSVIDWVMRERGLEFRDAVLWLQRYEPSAGNVEMTCGKSPRQKVVPPLRKGEDCAAESADSPFDKGGLGISKIISPS